MNVAIIDYGSGNIKSIQYALERLGVNAKLSYRYEDILASDRIIFPGVGEASSALKKLKESRLHKIIPNLKQPVLGICLGMQLMCNYTEEGNTKGLGVFNTNVKRFSNKVKVPQMGWNTISNLESKLFANISEKEHMYLIHSYYAELCHETIATTDYELKYASALQKNNFYGVQFHPEKSSSAGQIILKNFLEL